MRIANPTIQFVKTATLPLLILGSMVYLSISPLLLKYPQIAIGITLDLAITLPLVYFFLIRKQPISKLTVVPVAVAGLFLSSIILPKAHLGTFHLLKQYVLPLIELFVITIIIVKVRKAIKSFKAHNSGSLNFSTALKNTTEELFHSKRLAAIFFTEISMIYFGVFKWKSPKLQSNEFSTYKNSGASALFLGLLLVVLIETVSVHFIMAKSSVFASWALTISSVYVAIQVLAQLKAMRHLPIVLKDDRLQIKNGLFAQTEVDIKHIEEIVLYSKDIEKEDTSFQLALLEGLEPYNVCLKLSESQTLIKLYGIRKSYKKLYFYVDNPTEFIGLINEKCQKASDKF